MASRGLFPGASSKASDLSNSNSRTFEQALSYFIVDDLLKQELWFSAMIFHQRSAEFYFSWLT